MSDLQPEKPLWLFFDECLSRTLMDKLYEFFKDGFARDDLFKVAHLTDFMAAGSEDDVWMKALDSERRWIVLSKDFGASRKKPDLPTLCKEMKRTHLLISAKIKGYEQEKEVITQIWKHIRLLPYLPEGTRAFMRYLQMPGGLYPVIHVDQKPIDKWCVKNGIYTSIMFPNGLPNLPKQLDSSQVLDPG
jgi:hypothetical protein